MPYFTASGCDIAQSDIPLFIFAWNGAPAFSATDTRVAFPGFSSLTRGQLRTFSNNVNTFITNTFPNGQAMNSQNWDLGYVVACDSLPGGTDPPWSA